MISVLIADDHALVRRGLRNLLESEPDLRVTAEAADGAEALDCLRSQSIDVLITDISMPGLGGLELLEEVRRCSPSTRVIILTMHPEERFAVRAIRAGASGYLTKDSATADLARAVRKAHSGGRFISPEVADQLAEHLDAKTAKPRHEALSDRELEVLLLIAGGRTMVEIARELTIGLATARTYRARLMEKLHLKSNVEITHYALDHNLLDRKG